MPSFTPTQPSEPPISVAEAQSRVLEAVAPFDAVILNLLEAAGSVLREDVVAEWDVPGADNSAMDGYAVRASDLSGASAELPARLRVVGDAPAGIVSSAIVESGDAVRIMTGASIPRGADTVVPVEVTDAGLERVAVMRELATGTNVRRRGEDIRAGDVVIRAGTVIGAGEIGVLATVGRPRVAVSRRPRVAILSTGSELVDPGVRPEPGQVTNSNAWALAALARECGGEPQVVGRVMDSLEGTIKAIESVLDCDIVLTSGGVSVGAWDFVKDAVGALGAETRFWRVAMKPGKPVLFAVLKNRLIFGLPGNPVSSMVGFHLFVAPAIRKGLGRSAGWLPPVVTARASAPMKSKGDRPTYLRVRIRASGGEFVADPMKLQGSGVTTSMVGANGLALMAEGTTCIEEGGLVNVVLIGPIESD